MVLQDITIPSFKITERRTMPHREYAAHLSPDRAPHTLEKHLVAVAKLAAENATSFKGADLARLLGLWHDLGKYNPAWQEYLRKVAHTQEDAHLEGKSGSRGPNHSSAGALYAADWLRRQTGVDVEP